MTVDTVAPIGPELGTVYDTRRMFVQWADGKVFDYGEQFEAPRFTEMLGRDGKARTLEQVLTLPMRSTPFSFQPGKGDRGEQAFVDDALSMPVEAGGMATPLPVVLGQMTGAVIYRKAFFELVWRADPDAKVRLQKLAWRPPQTCYPWRDQHTGDIIGFKQRTWRPGIADPDIEIPGNRSFVFVHGTHRDPLEGISDLDVALWCYETKQKIRFLWYAFLENQSLPKALATSADGDDLTVQDLARKVATLKNGGVIGLKNGQTVTPFESSGKGADQFQAAITFLNQEMAGSVLAGFTELANGHVGSYALSADQSDFFLLSRQAVVKEMGAQFTHQVVAPLVRYNFGADAAIPRLEFGPINPESTQRAIDVLNTMAGRGVALIPREFVDELTVKVAAYLELDVDKVAQAIRKAQLEAPPTPAGQMGAAVNVGTSLVAQQKALQATSQQEVTPGAVTFPTF